MDGAAIAEVLDDHGFGHRTDAKKFRFVNYALKELLDTETWPFLIDEESPVTVASQSNVPITKVWKGIRGINDTTNKNTLIPYDRQLLYRKFPGDLADTGKPLYYYFLNGTDGVNELDIHLWPIPDAVYTLRVNLFLGQADISASSAEALIVLPPDRHMLICHKTLQHLYAQDDDLSTSEYFQNLYATGLDRMRVQMHTTQVDRPIVQDEYDY